MKKPLTTLLTAALLLAVIPITAHAQTAPAAAPYGQPTVLTKEQAQAQTKTQLANAQVQYIGILERGFDQISNLVTANPYHLSQADVVDGFGGDFAAQTQRQGALMLSTIIKANKNLGRADKWLTQEWVRDWIRIYKLDPLTGDPLPTP